MSLILQRINFNQFIDHTFLKTEEDGLSKSEQIKNVNNLCHEAHQYNAYSVCIRPTMLKTAQDKLSELNSIIKTCVVIGFPRGDDHSLESKLSELEEQKSLGADEFDMVIPYLSFKNGDSEKVYNEVLELSKAAKDHTLKVIFEMASFDENDKNQVIPLVIKAFKDSGNIRKRFLKTSTGFYKINGITCGATLEDVKLFSLYAKGEFGIKPAGGIKNYADAFEFYQAVQVKKSILGPMDFRIGSSSLLLELNSKTCHTEIDY